MTELLIKLFIKNHQRTDLPEIRTKYGMLSGIAGIAVNTILCIIKFSIGAITGSIAITGDALNNLSDAGSSAVSLFGFKLSSKPADKEHPYGHGRIEYVCGLGVAVLILLMGYELIKGSADKIRNPEETVFSWVAVAVLLLSVPGKIWLAVFNKKINKRIDSKTVDAVVKDSISDIAATLASVISLILSNYFDLPFDGIFGIAVSCFVIYAGIGVFKSTLTPLLGQPPTEETVRYIQEQIMSYDGIIGVHDLIIHDYGHNRCFVTAHAEVPSETDIMESHDLIDIIEQDLKAKTGYNVTLHMDPLNRNDDEVEKAREKVMSVIYSIEPLLTIHDFRMVSGPHHTNLIFDLVIPFSVTADSGIIVDRIKEKLAESEDHYNAVITVDRSYI